MKHIDPQTEKVFHASMGGRIKAIRRNWKWSQTDMARALKVDQASVSFWEADKIRPSGAALVALASLFRTNVDALQQGGEAFSMPETPCTPQAPRLTASVLRSVSLPLAANGGLMVVDLGDGSARELNLSDTLVRLNQGVDDKRKAWVILG